MKKTKYLALAVSFILSIMCGIAQEKHTLEIGSEKYKELKANGTLSMSLEDYELSYPTFGKHEQQPILSGFYRGGGGIPEYVQCGQLVERDSLATPSVAGTVFDDGSSDTIFLPFDFCFYGDLKTKLFINANGNISFDSPYGTFTSNAFPTANFSMIAPFWADVDNSGDPLNNNVGYEIFSNFAIFKWDAVGYYAQHYDKRNTFQLVISDGTSPIIPGGNNVAFIYGDMQWTTGDVSGGNNGFGGTPATVGANLGDGVNYFQLGRFDHAGIDYDGPVGNNDGVSWLDYQVFAFNVCPSSGSSNIPPVLSNFGLVCDTLELCHSGTGLDTLPIELDFIAPEPGQTTVTSIDTTGVDGFTLISNTSGISSQIVGHFVATPNNSGINVITFTAVDDGTPADTTIFEVVIRVSQIEDPIVTGDTAYCYPGSATVELVNDTFFDHYQWSDGSLSPDSIIELQGGSHTLMAFNSEGCVRIVDIEIEEWGNYPLDKAALDIACHGDSSGSITFVQNDTVPLSFTWISSGGDTLQYTESLLGQDSLTDLTPGDYYVVISDSHNCHVLTDTTTIAEPAQLTADSQIINETCEDTNGIAIIQIFGGTPIYDYNWSPVSGSQAQLSGLSAGIYIVTTTDANGCERVDTLEVGNIVSPVANFTEDMDTTLANEIISFADQSDDVNDTITDWYWDFGDGSISVEQNPTHAYTDTGLYDVMLIVTNTDGCMDTIISDIYVSPELMLPNVFTPDGDSKNDYLEFANLKALYPGSGLKVYNRWGRKVYESEDYQNDWDADKCRAGTYFFELILSDGTIKTGHVLIIK